MEQWADVFGYDTMYQVSNLGRVRTNRHKYRGYVKDGYRIVEPTDNGKGYMRFNWKRGGKQVTVYLHRLVAEAFVENANNLPEVNHKDEDKSNNDASNLEWVTHLENCNHGTRNERTAEKRRVMVRCVESGTVYDSVKHASESMGVCKTAISNCLNGRSSSSGGYHWEYA